MLSPEQIRQFRQTGHLTVPNFLDVQTTDSVIDDIAKWSREFLQTLSPEEHRWYLEQSSGNQPQLRKLDNPVYHRKVFRELAANNSLVEMVEQLIGRGVSVFFSQVFMKPPQIGGEKPIHQDNFYFGPDDPDAILTAWIALDDASAEIGGEFGDPSRGAIKRRRKIGGDDQRVDVHGPKATVFAQAVW